MTHVEQALRTFPKHLKSAPLCGVIRVTQSLVLYDMFCGFLFFCHGVVSFFVQQKSLNVLLVSFVSQL